MSLHGEEEQILGPLTVSVFGNNEVYKSRRRNGYS